MLWPEIMVDRIRIGIHVHYFTCIDAGIEFWNLCAQTQEQSLLAWDLETGESR